MKRMDMIFGALGKSLKYAVLAVMCVVVLAACGSSKSNEDEEGKEETKKEAPAKAKKFDDERLNEIALVYDDVLYMKCMDLAMVMQDNSVAQNFISRIYGDGHLG